MSGENGVDLQIRERIPLADYSTLGLGGMARYFVECSNDDQIAAAVDWASSKDIPLFVLGGGSNCIISDNGVNGLVVRITMKGIDSTLNHGVATVIVRAGVVWDEFVQWCVQKNFGGIECLSGIPGTVGATPIQNVGAYGQEVKDTLISVRVYDRKMRVTTALENEQCFFGYRSSRFKKNDRNRYIILDAVFQFRNDYVPIPTYPELEKAVHHFRIEQGAGDKPMTLVEIRNAVLALRKRKSMIFDPQDPNSRSVGSYFMNPLVQHDQFTELDRTWKKRGHDDSPPGYTSSEGIKISAAWLIEQAGFHKGYRHKGVGISSNHALALVNYGGTTEELLELESAIIKGVEKYFDIRLEREAVFLS